jgi:uncharacterized cupin superfamily protein
MNYVRLVDFAAIDGSGPDERLVQALFDHTSGAKTCTIHCIKTPAGGGSPAGLHTHQVDQIFYILKGTMGIEIEGKEYEVGPGALVVFPAGVPHRNGTVALNQRCTWRSTPRCRIRTCPSRRR